MKTAVSIPDQVFQRAEKMARSLKVSRSELYTAALKEFVAQRDDKSVTEKLNEVYEKEDSKLDSVLERMQFSSLPEEPW
jgi:metal-responsive CopG/Arc/MetJ family transcriptional regulator